MPLPTDTAPDAAVRFLAGLACRAPGARLAALFAVARAAQGLDGLVRLACGFGLASALGRFVSELPEEDAGPDLIPVVLEGLRAEARSAGQLRLLRSLLERPEVRGTRPIALKGAGLVLSGATTAAERNFVDVDLLVPPGSAAAWAEAAAGIGARFEPSTGHECGTIVRDSALVELHATLPGDIGREVGPPYEQVLALSVPARDVSLFPDVLVPLPGLQREIAVHHFLRHHLGDPAFALRALQDLACLAAEPDRSGTRWPRPGVARDVAWMEAIALAVGRGELSTPGPAEFLGGLARVAGHESLNTFSDEVDLWIASAPTGFGGRIRFLLSHLFPPGDELGSSPGEAVCRRAVRLLLRPGTLLSKYSRAWWSGRRDRRRGNVLAWRSLLARSSRRPR